MKPGWIVIMSFAACLPWILSPSFGAEDVKKGADDVKKGAKTQIVEKEGKKYKVVLESEKKRIRVFAPTPPQPVPSRMFVRIRTGNEILDKISLHLIDTKRKGGEALYQGRLDLTQANQAGIQFDIEFGRVD